ncbi:heterokaryon incompatibility protein-domain-containing protein [Apiosordaria backusii]|uniref:Heterokaryon incompatibility protein-domain-containing protein n=1 Tax=Apiosordaria backusii TaxID=314023 RepID=A0AA40EEU4_9PEZI|nr:heterokaryon incompatibility protein-domain-containing protein [Apiosordaria backusii]
MASPSWHEPTCNRPDVSLTDGIPFCMSCGSMGPLDDLEPSEAPPAIPILSGKRSDLSLSWPFSVKYAAQCTDEDGNDLGDVLQSIVKDLESLAENNGNMPQDAKKEAQTSDIGPHSSSSTLAQQYRIYQDSLVSLDRVNGNDSIRLLRLSKGKGSDPLHGTLETQELKYFPEYEALSYTWADANGHASRTKKLYLGKEWTVFPITTNCEAALRHIRLPNTERHLWVDTVCINQFDNLERSHQVQLMPMIYATAQRVLIYLGEDEPQQNMMSRHLPMYSKVMEWSHKWDDLGPILQRPYFFRSWIIQEIASAKTALVANGSSWRVWPIYDKKTDAGLFLPWIKEFETRKYKTSRHLFELITDCWTSQAYDPRDKVFSLLGVISGAAADGLVADYTLTVEQIHTGLATFVLKNHRQADLLKYAAGYAKSSGLPSWVPDWHVLSRNWDIMAQIRSFHSFDTRVSLTHSHRISSYRTEQIREPWFMDDMSKVMFTDVDIHGPTGSLCIPGMKIEELSPDRYTSLPCQPPFIHLPDLPPGHYDSVTDCSMTCFRGPLFVIGMTGSPNDSSRLSVWFLHGINTPVILRQSLPTRNIFSFVSHCYIRVQTGVCMFRGLAEGDNYNLDSYTISEKGYTIGSVSRHRDKKEKLPRTIVDLHRRSVLTQPQHLDYNDVTQLTINDLDELHEALKKGEKLEKCYESQIMSLQMLGGHAETTWTGFIQSQVPIVLLLPSLRKVDLMAPVVLLLEDLGESLKRMREFWGEIVSLLEAAQLLGNTVEGVIRENYEQRAEELAHLRQRMWELENNREERVWDHEPEQGWLKRNVRALYTCTTEEEMELVVKRMVGNLEERGGIVGSDGDGEQHQQQQQRDWVRDGLPCPVWYLIRPGLQSWWLGMRKADTLHARELLMDLVNGCGNWKKSESSMLSGESALAAAPREPGDDAGTSVNEDNIKKARVMKEKFEAAEVEVKLTIMSVKILMEKRKEYARLMKGEWKKIVIV